VSNFHISAEDHQLMLRAVDALRRMNPPEYLDARLVQLRRRIESRLPHFSDGDLRNICLGLEVMLRDNPLDWKAETLLRRLNSFLDNHPDNAPG